MKTAVKTFIFWACALAASVPVWAAPVKMTLTYDGKTREYNAEEIRLIVDGKPAELTLMPPIILDGWTYVPSREVFEPLGAAVDWKDASRELYIGYNNTLIVIKPDADTAEVNGQPVPMQTPAKIINNKLMIPARFAAESLGIPVSWDGASRTVSIGAGNGESLYVPEDVPEPSAPAVPEAPSAPAAGVSEDISPEPLTVISGGQTDITGFKAEGAVFTISASGPITRVDKVLLTENKLVLDIYDSANALSAASYGSGGFGGVSSVRNSQFQLTPVKITRIVFDLSGSNRFSVSFGEGRKSIIVSFEENLVTDISYKQLDDGEQLTLTCTLPPSLEYSRLFDPDRLVFDISGASYSGPEETSVNGRFTERLRASQFEARTVRIVLDLNENPQFNVEYKGNQAIITLTTPTYKNVGYTQTPAPAVLLKDSGIDASSVSHTDNYLNGSYIITLNGDYSAHFGFGEFVINDSVINSVTLRSEGGRTEIVISQKAIYAYEAYNEGGNLVIKPVNPKSVYKNVVYLDAGHGGKDPGAVANGFQEKNLNLNIVQRLYEHLENDPEIKVYASRLDDSYPENISRALTANHMADLFVSVHHNAAESSKTNGTEVLYLNHEGEVYPGISSEAVARIFQTNLVRDLGTTDRGVVKRPNLIVLNSTSVPAVIVEIIFMTNLDDINKVSAPEGRQLVADSLYRSIKEIFAQYPTGR